MLAILHKSRETILLLASEPNIRKVICRALQNGGYFVLEAPSIGTAIERLKDSNPHLLIVRHYTEYISGQEAAVYLRSIRPGIPVLLLGGRLDDPGLDAREAVHDFNIFPKPYSAAELLAEVRKLLNKYSGRGPQDTV
jgi:two-component system, OmpR family, response regulator